MRINWFYLLIGIIFLAMLFINVRYFRGSADATIGMAQSIPYKINSEKSALVKSVLVIAGMQVKEVGESWLAYLSSAQEGFADWLSCKRDV